MELYEAMTTAFSARDYTDDPVDDGTLYRMLDHARFAPSGGNRQGWRVIIVRDQACRTRLKQLIKPTLQQYLAQMRAGEVPFNTIHPSRVGPDDIARTPTDFKLIDTLESAPAVLVVCVDLARVSAFDSQLNRVGVISGASIYPFVWNLLLGARNEGLGGVLTTFLAREEVEAKRVLHLPDEFAIAAMVVVGKPVKQLTRLKRDRVESFTRFDRWDGDAFEPLKR